MKLTKEQAEMLKGKFNKMQLDSFDLGAEFVIRIMKENIANNNMMGFIGTSNIKLLDDINYIEKVIRARRENESTLN